MFLKNKPINSYILFCLSLFFLFILIGCQTNYFFRNDGNAQDFKNVNNLLNLNISTEPIVRESNRLLDGMIVEKDKKNLLPVAVMLDNFPGAPRPSLSGASIIYEVPVEGGLTRFLAIFDLDALPDNLGPIRSARPYFLELAEEYKPLYIHAGGSPEALLRLKQGFYKVINLDEISWQTRYFWRSGQEPAPHNLYIQREQIQKFLTDQKINKKIELIGWQFDQGGSHGEKEANRVKIDFSVPSSSEWLYDSVGDEYQLFKNNQIYKDRNGNEIRANNLIVQYVPIKVIDEIGRRQITLTGQGRALIFQTGKVIEGKWIKEAGRTKFYNHLGEEIIFLPGKTWISIVASNVQINY